GSLPVPSSARILHGSRGRRARSLPRVGEAGRGDRQVGGRPDDHL
ncbi:MAG: hypothetical protein AVDCRST_MAG19-4816, partial [uncultured Thermomicrobiales bacterium]